MYILCLHSSVLFGVNCWHQYYIRLWSLAEMTHFKISQVICNTAALPNIFVISNRIWKNQDSLSYNGYPSVPSALPPLVILENLKELLSADVDAGCQADINYVLNKLCELGYAIVTWILSKAEQHGSCGVRWRLYFIAIRVPLTLENNIEELISIKRKIGDLNNSMRLESGDPLDFLLPYKLDDDSDHGNDEEQAAKKLKDSKGVKCKDEHFELFAHANLIWPPDLTELKAVDYSKMSNRVMEIVYYICKVYHETANKHPANTL